MRDEATIERRPLVSLLPVVGSFGACGLFDGLLSLMNGAPGGLGGALCVFLVTVGFWMLIGYACWASLRLAVLVAGGEALSDSIQKLRTSVDRARYESDPQRDRERLATLCGWVAGLSGWLLLGMFALAYLIANRHGPWLISFASLVAHLLLIPAGVMVGLTSRRVALSLLENLAPREPFGDLLRARSLFTALHTAWRAGIGLTIIVMVVAESLSWDNAPLRLFRAVDGAAFSCRCSPSPPSPSRTESSKAGPVSSGHWPCC